MQQMGHYWTVLSYLYSLSGPTLTLLYPLYTSVQAIESPSKLDDEQWLAYWIIYSFLTLSEMLVEPVLTRIRIWGHVKLVLVAWLVLPQFRGAAFIYDRFVREKLRKHRDQGKDGGDTTTSSSPPTDKGKNKFVSFVTPKKAEKERH